jgi:hypothetical protein
MQVVKRTLNWLPRQSMYEQAQEQRAKRREANEAFVSGQQTMMAAFTSASQNYTMGIAEITAQVASARVSKQIKLA